MLSMNEEAFTVMANQMAGGMTLTENKKPILVEWMKQADRETYVYGYTDLLKLDLREELANIESPVVIFAATQPYGKDLVKTNIQKQFESLKEYELVMAENAAHFIMFDRPDWFNATLKEYLNRK
jgi:pimeloyl-ACP methyl ester carboxylesterase